MNWIFFQFEIGLLFQRSKKKPAGKGFGGEIMKSDEMLPGWEDQLFEERREKANFTDE